MASFGKLQKRVRSAYFRKDFKAWQDAMLALNKDGIVNDTITPPWDDYIIGEREWSSTNGRYLKVYDHDNDNVWIGTSKRIFPYDEMDLYRDENNRELYDAVNSRTKPFTKRSAQMTSYKPHPSDAYKPIIMEAPGIDPYMSLMAHRAMDISIGSAMAVPAVAHVGIHAAHHPIGLIAHDPDIYKHTPEMHMKIEGPKWTDAIMTYDEGHPDGDFSFPSLPTVKDDEKFITGIEELLEKVNSGEIVPDSYIRMDSISEPEPKVEYTLDQMVKAAKDNGYTLKAKWPVPNIDKVKLNCDYQFPNPRSFQLFDPDIANKITEHARNLKDDTSLGKGLVEFEKAMDANVVGEEKFVSPQDEKDAKESYGKKESIALSYPKEFGVKEADVVINLHKEPEKLDVKITVVKERDNEESN